MDYKEIVSIECDLSESKNRIEKLLEVIEVEKSYIKELEKKLTTYFKQEFRGVKGLK